jgi:hypothetical protein
MKMKIRHTDGYFLFKEEKATVENYPLKPSEVVYCLVVGIFYLKTKVTTLYASLQFQFQPFFHHYFTFLLGLSTNENVLHM